MFLKFSQLKTSKASGGKIFIVYSQRANCKINIKEKQVSAIDC